MLAQAVAELPNECCGLLAGTIDTSGPEPVARVTHRYPLVNAAGSPVTYDADPKSLFQAHKAMRQAGVELLAIYHSHPTSEPVPSKTDRERNYYGAEVVHFIISLQGPEPVMRGWRIDGDVVTETQWQVG